MLNTLVISTLIRHDSELSKHVDGSNPSPIKQTPNCIEKKTPNFDVFLCVIIF